MVLYATNNNLILEKESGMEKAKKKRVLIIKDEETNLLVGAMLIEAIGDFEAIEPGMVNSPN